jgi:hypothetical protein
MHDWNNYLTINLHFIAKYENLLYNVYIATMIITLKLKLTLQTPS